MYQGRCLCGQVHFSIEGELGPADICHCRQCRQWTGHVLASTEVARSALTITGLEHLQWFQSSVKVRRGFCRHCGSSLFFDPLDTQKHQWIGVALGAIEDKTHITIGKHIFVAEKGDYYPISDGAPQHDH